MSDTCDWIDIDYRVEFVDYVLEYWRGRLKGLLPYKDRRYRMYVYEDLAPTISVVAETDIGFPYGNGTPVFVDCLRNILKLYESRSWMGHFIDLDWTISEKKLLTAVERNNGSISKATANHLGLPVAKLRTLIINMGLGVQVNSIRKKFKRRPADFNNEFMNSDRWHVFERILPPRYH